MAASGARESAISSTWNFPTMPVSIRERLGSPIVTVGEKRGS